MEASTSAAAAVKMSKDSVVIECKMDEVITKSKTCAKFQPQLGLQSLSEANVLRLRRLYGNTLIASISVLSPKCKIPRCPRSI